LANLINRFRSTLVRTRLARVWKRPARLASVASLALIAILSAPRIAAGYSINFPPTDFTIYSPDGTQTLGSSHYYIEQVPGGEIAILHGEDRYLDGGYDIESERLQLDHNGGFPALLEFDHTFFAADGSPTMRGHADLRSGLASCDKYGAGTIPSAPQQVTFPPDTYAGASLLIPLQSFLGAGNIDKLHLHAFSCTPGPRVFAITASVDANPVPKALFSDSLVKVDAHPDFGWITFLVQPFVPKLDAWFDPNGQWRFMGAELARFYGGTPIMMVTTQSQSDRAAAAQK